MLYEVVKLVVVYPNLYQKMLDYGVSNLELAELLRVDIEVILDKMRGVTPWYLHEAVHICMYFDTSDVENLFVRLDSNT